MRFKWLSILLVALIATALLAGCGTQTAGLSFGGYGGKYLATTEWYTSTILPVFIHHYREMKFM